MRRFHLDPLRSARFDFAVFVGRAPAVPKLGGSLRMEWFRR